MFGSGNAAPAVLNNYFQIALAILFRLIIRAFEFETDECIPARSGAHRDAGG
jgi:hypothetical protein